MSTFSEDVTLQRQKERRQELDEILQYFNTQYRALLMAKVAHIQKDTAEVGNTDYNPRFIVSVFCNSEFKVIQCIEVIS